ncbi:MAG: hypothetical protein NTU86_06235 [Burkholderiales bacterium]|nr:hypothetical protein [Burkholderiales bacterium]
MDNEQKLKVLESLAKGINPLTGEILGGGDFLLHPTISDALQFAASICRDREGKKLGQAENVGQKWSREEDLLVSNSYSSGKTIQEIATTQHRTQRAIRSRLTKLGLISLYTGNVDGGPNARNDVAKQTVGRSPLQDERQVIGVSPTTLDETASNEVLSPPFPSETLATSSVDILDKYNQQITDYFSQIGPFEKEPTFYVIGDGKSWYEKLGHDHSMAEYKSNMSKVEELLKLWVNESIRDYEDSEEIKKLLHSFEIAITRNPSVIFSFVKATFSSDDDLFREIRLLVS